MTQDIDARPPQSREPTIGLGPFVVELTERPVVDKAVQTEIHREEAVERVTKALTELELAEREISDWGTLVPNFIYAPRFLSLRNQVSLIRRELEVLAYFLAHIPKMGSPVEEVEVPLVPEWPGRGDWE
ncbi:MAG: hypothetical protein KAY24_00390 [Candidatus Eisenbacteria sp.]|nr:hypothetical protein [Candidatus Eisenbacteria bacterium]